MDYISSATGGAYGAGKAGVPFNPLEFIKKPQVILRILCLLFAVIVFGCISSEGWVHPVLVADTKKICQYNKDGNACRYGTAIGVIAFLVYIGLLIVDAMFDNFSNIKHRRYAVMGDLGFSAFWAFLWFVGFCYLTDQWRKGQDDRKIYNPSLIGTSALQAAIAFSFFSIFSTAGVAGLAFMRYRQGVSADFQGGFDDQASWGGQQQQPGAYAPPVVANGDQPATADSKSEPGINEKKAPDGGADGYQQAPFQQPGGGAPPPGGYQQTPAAQQFSDQPSY